MIFSKWWEYVTKIYDVAGPVDPIHKKVLELFKNAGKSKYFIKYRNLVDLFMQQELYFIS
ncbi:hypothetical protein LBYZC6_42150 [Lacrimispora brassicae]